MPTLDYQPSPTNPAPRPLTLRLAPDERFALAYLRSDRVESAWWGWLIVKLMIGALFIVGLGTENRALANISFILLLALDLYVAAKQPRVTRSIYSKPLLAARSLTRVPEKANRWRRRFRRTSTRLG